MISSENHQTPIQRQPEMKHKAVEHNRESQENTASENPETGYTDNRFYNTTIELLRNL